MGSGLKDLLCLLFNMWAVRVAKKSQYRKAAVIAICYLSEFKGHI